MLLSTSARYCHKLSSVLLRHLHSSRNMSSSSLLISNPKYSFLKNDLGLEEVNPGVYDGQWKGSGQVSRVKFRLIIN